MKKLLVVVLALVLGIALTLLLRRPPPATASLATVPIIRKSGQEFAPAKHVSPVHRLYAGHHRPKN